MSTLKGNKNFYEYEGSDILAGNLKEFFQYGFTEMGAYTAIKFNLATSGYTNLKRVYDDRYGGFGRVYEGLGPSWVWESGISPIGMSISPFQVSGVYVNNTFYPVNTSGSHSFVVDYSHGRVIFSSGLIEPTSVKCEYTMRDIAIYMSDSPQWKTMVEEISDRYDELEDLAPSGISTILKEKRVWLPCVIIDVKDRTNKGLQLGGGEYSDYLVFYHVFSDKAFSNKRLADTISNQFQKVLTLYDINQSPQPLRFDGSIANGAQTYPQLANRNGAYFWTFAQIMNTNGGPVDNIFDLYRSECRHSIEVARYLSTY